MTFTLLRGLTAALTISGTVLAQQTIGPFFLRLQSDDADINGRYLGAYHSGATQATLGFQFNGLGTNDFATTLNPGAYANVGFDDENRLYMVDGPDDSQNQSGFEEDGGWWPNRSDTHNLRHWHACWQTAGISYYYWSLGWVTAGAPHNPTCKPVEVIKVDV